MIEIYAIDKIGNKYRVDDNLYFFEEQGIMDINNPESCYDQYIIEIYLNSNLIFSSKKEEL
jgi:hypothetical protein